MKRCFDLVVVVGFLPLWLPVLLLVVLAVRFRIGTPVFFRQQRPGLSGSPFGLLKFRTMTSARDAQGNLLP